jgi:hypothetical protein
MRKYQCFLDAETMPVLVHRLPFLPAAVTTAAHFAW